MSQVEAAKHLKNWGFGDHFRHFGWPKVADAVIDARLGISETQEKTPVPHRQYRLAGRAPGRCLSSQTALF